MSEPLEPQPFTVESDSVSLAGETVGEGPPIVLAHGLTATRRFVLHGSRALPRRGFEVISYDARGHGESSPAPEGRGYSYAELAADLGAVVAARAGERPVVLAGDSLGAHTALAWALQHIRRLAGIAIVRPAYPGVPTDEAQLAEWDHLAEGLERGGVEGFVEAYDEGLDPEWRETLIRITRERLVLHHHPEAVARAMREVPRDQPFEPLDELRSLQVPALVVGSRDEADPGHPLAVAEAYAEHLPDARLLVEDEGASPLAWQGGRLSRAIADFCEGEAVRRRGFAP